VILIIFANNNYVFVMLCNYKLFYSDKLEKLIPLLFFVITI